MSNTNQKAQPIQQLFKQTLLVETHKQVIKNKPKNNVNTEITLTVDQLNEQIAATEQEITTLTEQLKEKKAALKELTKQRSVAEKAAAEAKEAEQKAKLLEAVAASGKSIDEVIALIQG